MLRKGAYGVMRYDWRGFVWELHAGDEALNSQRYTVQLYTNFETA